MIIKSNYYSHLSLQIHFLSVHEQQLQVGRHIRESSLIAHAWPSRTRQHVFHTLVLLVWVRGSAIRAAFNNMSESPRTRWMSIRDMEFFPSDSGEPLTCNQTSASASRLRAEKTTRHDRWGVREPARLSCGSPAALWVLKGMLTSPICW